MGSSKPNEVLHDSALYLRVVYELLWGALFVDSIFKPVGEKGLMSPRLGAFHDIVIRARKLLIITKFKPRNALILCGYVYRLISSNNHNKVLNVSKRY